MGNYPGILHIYILVPTWGFKLTLPEGGIPAQIWGKPKCSIHLGIYRALCLKYFSLMYLHYHIYKDYCIYDTML